MTDERPSNHTAGDPVVHLVRQGRYPHVVQRGFNESIRQHEALDQVSCAECLARAGEFIGTEVRS